MDDTREISGSSRFLSGGIGGISSQLSQYSRSNTYQVLTLVSGIYPIETLKVYSGHQRAWFWVDIWLDANDEQRGRDEALLVRGHKTLIRPRRPPCILPWSSSKTSFFFSCLSLTTSWYRSASLVYFRMSDYYALDNGN